MARKKKQAEQHHWSVPFKWTCRGYAFVEAATAEEATAKAQAGDYESLEASETIDWRATGQAELNE